MMGKPPFRMIANSLHQMEKPITPRMTDTMPLISKDIAEPPDLMRISAGLSLRNPLWKKNLTRMQNGLCPPQGGPYRIIPITEGGIRQDESLSDRQKKMLD
jgi:hypothetical protein